MRLAMVCVLPVPGGPCTMTVSFVSSSSITLRCSGLACLVSNRSIEDVAAASPAADRKSTRLNSSHTVISYAVFCLKKKKLSADTYAQQTRIRATCQPSAFEHQLHR